jgi:hypothetical protein
VGEWWVAGAEDQVGLCVDAELFLERRAYVDFAEDAEALFFEFLADALDRLVVWERASGAECVAGCEHGHSSSR